MSVTLRPYQSHLLSSVYQAYHAGARNVLAVLPTGGGKSVVVSQIILDGHQQGLSEAVIAHRNELVGQMSMHLARRGIPHRIIASRASVAQITAEHRREFGRSFVNPNAPCSVISVDTLIARQESLTAWAAQVQRWTIDECFPAGTMIRTSYADRPIETIEVGDLVTAFDEKTGTFAAKRVVRLFRNPAPHTMFDIHINGSKVTATPGHPFWTERGWVEAKDLRDGDRCLVELLGVRNGVSDRHRASTVSAAPGWKGVLQQVVRIRPSNETRQETHQTTGITASETMPGLLCRSHAIRQDVFGRMPQQDTLRNNGSNEPQVCVRAHDSKQPNEAPRVAREDARYTLAYEPPAEGTGRQREAANGSGTAIDRRADTVRVQTATRRADGLGQNTGADSLQTRHGAPRFESLHRSGRQIARSDSETTIRRAQGCVFEWRRVDRIEVHQSTNTDRDRNGFVYNIEVDDLHTYVANGIVVHNCHHVLGSNKWGKAVAMFPNAYGLGVTATPSRADGCGLGRHHDGLMDAMIVGPSMRDLIDLGALCDYEIAAPESDMVVDEDDFAASGDLSPAKGRLASQRSHIVGDVVKEYMKHAPGKRGICFATDVETAGEMANRFNEAGVLAAAVSAKTPTETRNDYIRRFRVGQLTILVNVDLFGEGFDVPAVEVVIMARPTASLAVYLQQFGRALRPLEGKARGLVIDHVSNWKRHGFPDKPHPWTLDRRDKRAKRAADPDDIPLTACRSCSRPYERFRPACPYCGAEPPLPEGGARSIDQVDGDLVLLDRDTLAAMRAAAQLEAPGDMAARVSAAAGSIAGAGAANRQMARHASQERLRAAVEQWAGIRRHMGESDREIMRRFYLTAGVDVLSAMAMSRADMDRIAGTVEGWYS